MKDNKTRAVKVKLRNRIAALSVVRKASLLKGTKNCRQRALVEEVRKRRAHPSDDYNRRHYIRNGEVVSVHRPRNNQQPTMLGC